MERVSCVRCALPGGVFQVWWQRVGPTRCREGSKAGAACMTASEGGREAFFQGPGFRRRLRWHQNGSGNALCRVLVRRLVERAWAQNQAGIVHAFVPCTCAAVAN